MNNYILQTLANAIDVINVFETESEPLTIADLVKRTNMNRTNLYRILYTLRTKGLIEMDADTGKYRLGIRIVQLSSLVLQRLSIRQIARPHLQRFNETVNETTHLVVINDKKVIFIDKLEIQQTILMGSYIGWVAPLYCTASGKLLLSYREKEFIQDYLKAETFNDYTLKTLSDAGSLLKDLERIKLYGYAIDDEEMVEGLTCFAAPIFATNEKVLATVSVSGPTSRMVANREKIIHELLDCVKRVTLEISSTSEISVNWI